MTKSTTEAPEESEDPLDQTVFHLNEQQTKEFAEALSSSPLPNEALREMMARPAPWDSSTVRRPL